MINLNVYFELAGIKNSSPFTQKLSTPNYINGVKKRIGIYYGLDARRWSDEDVLNFLKTYEIIKK